MHDKLCCCTINQHQRQLKSMQRFAFAPLRLVPILRSLCDYKNVKSLTSMPLCAARVLIYGTRNDHKTLRDPTINISCQSCAFKSETKLA